VAFLAGFVEAVAASDKLPEFEVLPLVTDDPTAASWPNLFCLQCYIQTKAKRTFPPEPLTAAGVTGELARLVTDHDSPQVARRYVHAEVESLRAALKTTRQRKAVATPAP
jgi:hypothetical protein